MVRNPCRCEQPCTRQWSARAACHRCCNARTISEEEPSAANLLALLHLHAAKEHEQKQRQPMQA